MLIRLHQLKSAGSPNTIGVNMEAIEVSVAMAVLHVFLEVVNLHIEARTWKTHFRDYMVACHNAKQGWIAQRTDFIASNLGQNDHRIDHKREAIQFDNKEDYFCNQGFSVNFNFTDLSIESLINIISNLPKIDNPDRRNTVQLGPCIQELSVEKFLQLLTLSYQKVNLVFTDPHLYVRSIFYRNLPFMKSVRSPYGGSNSGEPLLIDMVRKDYHQVVQVLIDIGAKFDLHSKDHGESLLQIAFTRQYADTMKVLMKLIDKDEKYVKDSIEAAEMFYDELFLKEGKKKPLCPEIFLEPRCLVPFEMQVSVVYNLPRLIRKDEKIAMQQWDLVFGAFMPPIIFKIGDDMESVIPIVEKWLARYPDQYTVCSLGNKAAFDSVFLSSFAGFRRDVYGLKDKIEGIVTKYFNRTIDLEKYEVEIEDLVNVYKIINRAEELDDLALERCDELVRNFGLDKMRDVYFHYSRKLADEDPADLVRSAEVPVPMKEKWIEYKYTVPKDAVAIKSFKLTMLKKGLTQPENIKLFVEYHIGYQKAEIRPPITFKVDPNAASAQNTDEEI